jgi:hypothetical protein
MLSKRPNVSDADWVALGAIIEDSDYIAEFKRLFGVDIAVK